MTAFKSKTPFSFILLSACATFVLLKSITGMINTVIFDLDGTLLDTLQDLTDSVNYALAAHGLPLREKSEVRAFLGNGYRYLISHAVPDGTAEALMGRVLSAFAAHYGEHCLDRTCPYEGIMPLLQTLKENNIKMAIVSNKGHEAVQQLAKRFFSGLIDIAVGESKSVRRKPNPDTVLEAMRMLGSTQTETVYVGDSEVDIETSKNAGVKAVTCLWGFRDKDFLLQHGATALIERPEELLQAIDASV